MAVPTPISNSVDWGQAGVAVAILVVVLPKLITPPRWFLLVVVGVAVVWLASAMKLPIIPHIGPLPRWALWLLAIAVVAFAWLLYRRKLYAFLKQFRLQLPVARRKQPNPHEADLAKVNKEIKNREPWVNAIEGLYPFTEAGLGSARRDYAQAEWLRIQLVHESWQHLVVLPITVDLGEFKDPGDPNIKFTIPIVNASLYQIDLRTLECSGQVWFGGPKLEAVKLQGTPTISHGGAGFILERGKMTDLKVKQDVGHLPRIVEDIAIAEQKGLRVMFNLSNLELSVDVVDSLTGERRRWRFGLVRSGFDAKTISVVPKP